MRKIFNKVVLGLLILALSFNGAAIAAEEHNVRVLLDGTELVFDVPPQIINGRVMVPMRKIFEALGANVEWDGSTRTIRAAKGARTVTLRVDNIEMLVDEDGPGPAKTTAVVLDAPVQLIDGRTLVPVRAVSEALDAAVGWDGESYTAFITTKGTAQGPDLSGVKIDYYEVNGNIPDYASITQKELLGQYKPDGFSYTWQYVYRYDKDDLGLYVACLKEIGFAEARIGRAYSGGDLMYYSKDADGVFVLFDESRGYIYINLFAQGTAEDIITFKDSVFYKENPDVPNYGYFMNVSPIRFDAGYTAAGTEVAQYLYPYSTGSWFTECSKYQEHLEAYGWKMSTLSQAAPPIYKFNYVKNNMTVSLTFDDYLKMTVVSIRITNKDYSKPPA